MGGGAATQTLTIATHSAYPELISDGDNWLLIARACRDNEEPSGRQDRQGQQDRQGPQVRKEPQVRQ